MGTTGAGEPAVHTKPDRVDGTTTQRQRGGRLGPGICCETTSTPTTCACAAAINALATRRIRSQ
jgi:hypothetical protein